MSNKKQSFLLLFILLFFTSLTILYLLWYPISYYYAWFRLKMATLLLNLFGLYPTFRISGIQNSQGEMFSFLPYASLMIATYRKKTLSHWKEISITFAGVLMIEVLGRFFEKLATIYPTTNLLAYLAIFFLGTARVGFPFLSWFYSLYRQKKPFKQLFSSEP